MSGKNKNELNAAIVMAVNNLRTLAGLFVILSAVPLTIAFGEMTVSGNTLFFRYFLAAVPTVLGLLMPAILYFLASFTLRRRELAARLAQRTAVGQSILILFGVLIEGFGYPLSWRHPGDVRMAMMPLAIGIFFLPAILVAAYSLFRARRAIAQLPELQHGFEIVTSDPAARPVVEMMPREVEAILPEAETPDALPKTR